MRTNENSRRHPSGAALAAGAELIQARVSPVTRVRPETTAAPRWSRPRTRDDVEIPRTRYAETADGVHVAYQVVGDGPVDVVAILSSFMSNVELVWEWPPAARLLRGLGTRARLLLFDRRGTGLSDGVNADAVPSLDARMDDIRAVMDAAGSERAVLYVQEDSVAQALLFAATYPERVSALVTWSAQVRGRWAPDYPFGWGDSEWDQWLSTIEAQWGTPDFVQRVADWLFPSKSRDREFVRGYGRLTRHSLSPGAALTVELMGRDLDVRHLLPAIQCPTLVVQPGLSRMVSAAEGQHLADSIAGARFAQTPRADHDPADVLPFLDEFLDSVQDEEAVFDRVLSTVLFTDIVDSTQRASELGDRQWRQLLAQHDEKVRALIARFRGRVVDTAGDGFFATFDGPARAVRCAQAIGEALQPLGLQVRAGLHTGEIETRGGQTGGIAVHIGARVAACAGADEVVVSSTVKELVTGSGVVFEDLGEHELKGVPSRLRLYRVVA
ncbi:MAG: adenylate/guanylate cyclase domain-containing protein [Actinomycetes bacterium]